MGMFHTVDPFGVLPNRTTRSLVVTAARLFPFPEVLPMPIRKTGTGSWQGLPLDGLDLRRGATFRQRAADVD